MAAVFVRPPDWMLADDADDDLRDRESADEPRDHVADALRHELAVGRRAPA